ncbi:hypothetical protein DSO57_1026416 [Entomophthora muscae]|uniref:Uncharacterized protein n=1 Tax=Entomophthora muscae TaxID=34485 RepID=A0ACC2UMG0_9FUNG|nr:hypothetical protein DSO57_1026416 [Entomophthora muscae]
MATAAVETSTWVAASLTPLEGSLGQLWAQQPSSERKYEFSGEIHMIFSKSQDGSGSTALSGTNPNYKPDFKQAFDPNTSTIVASLVVYETVMRHAPDELNWEHIHTCMHPIFQEVVVPNLLI